MILPALLFLKVILVIQDLLWFYKISELFVLALCSITLDGTPLQYSCLANPMDGGAW